jgi:hypothetical protein
MGFLKKVEKEVKRAGKSIDKEVNRIGKDIDKAIIQPVVKTVESIIDDPKKLLAVGLSVAFPGAGAALGAKLGLSGVAAQVVGQTLINTAINGGDLKSAAISAATPLMGRAGVNIVAENLAKSGITGTLNSVISNATVAGGTAAAFGGDPKAAFLLGGSAAAVNLLTPKIPGFNDLPDVAKNATKAALIAEMNKGNGTDAAINSVLNTGIRMANDYLKESFGMTGAIPAGLARAVSSQPQADPQGPAPGQQQGPDGRPLADPDQLVDEMVGSSRRSLSDLDPLELANLLYGEGSEESPVQQSQEEVDPLAKINVADIGFGSVDFGGKDFGGSDFGGKQELPFGRAFALARASGADTFEWRGKPYTTELAKESAAPGAASPAAPVFDSIGGGRGGQGGPTAEELAQYLAKGNKEPTAQELAAASKPYLDYSFKINPEMGDINKIADPRTRAFIGGLFGQAPDEQGFSVLHPDIEGIKSAGGAGYYTGIGSQIAAPIAKGISSIGGGIKSLLGGSSAGSNPALANFLKDSAIKDRLYHGTADDITEFMGGKNKSSSSSLAGWLAGDPAYASQYAAGKANASFGSTARPGANVMPVYANMRNPMNLDDPKILETIKEELPYMRIPPENLRYAMTEGQSGDALTDLARKLGFDAFQTVDEGFMTYAPFSGNQIKSAIGNIGTFNPRDMRLGYAEGGLAESAPEMSTDDLIELLMNMRQN